MKWDNYKNTYTEVKNRWQWCKIISLLSISLNLLLGVLAFKENTIIYIHPFHLQKDAWISSQNASTSYKEAWGLAISELLGNVTPANLEFIKERLSCLLSPKIYQEVMMIIHTQSAHIKNNNLSLRFEPQSIFYDKKTDKIFVSGYTYIKGPSLIENKEEKSYEFIFKIENNAISITHLDSYIGPAKIKKM